MDNARGGCTGAAHSSFCRLWAARRHADGSWYAVVEHQGRRRLEPVDRVANEAGHPAPFLRDPASSDTGQGGTVPRRPRVSSPPPRTARTTAASELAGLLSP